jgi:alanine racemase
MSAAPSNMKTTSGPWVDIDLAALCANYAMIRAFAARARRRANYDSAAFAAGAETGAVVKCDAYGLGMAPVARALYEREACRVFFVAYPEEGAALRNILKNGDATIYVMNGPAPETIALFARAALVPVLNSLEQARLWTRDYPGAAAALHIDTGMNRLGAPASAVSAIAALEGLAIDMVMSHLACASDPSHPMNDAQRTTFAALSEAFPKARRSLAASGGAMIDARFHFDLLRPGIALYGGSPFDADDARIKPVARLRAPVVQVRDLAPGETVGYGATFRASKPVRTATVALGYGDGFPRAGAGRAQAFLAGQRAPIAGRVSMDLISLDVTHLKTKVQVGDIATFFGDEIRLFETASACGTIGYELLTGLGGRIDRRYV